jgi:hypothetical protein
MSGTGKIYCGTVNRKTSGSEALTETGFTTATGFQTNQATDEEIQNRVILSKRKSDPPA